MGQDQPTTYTQPADAAARSAALDIRRSFAVSAPAGSGKTGLLTQRVLKLLAHSQHPEEVLAITFTRKAAGEMRERLLHALEYAQDNPRPDSPNDALTWDLARKLLARDQELGWRLLESPQRLRFQTIDGLCRSLASQLPIESGLGSPGEPLEQTRTAFEMAVTRLLGELDKPEPPKSLQRLLLHLDNDLGQLNKLLETLLEKREQWLGELLGVGQAGAQDYFHQVIDELVREKIQEATLALGTFTGELVMLADYAGSQLVDLNPDNPIATCAGMVELPSASPEGLQHWLALTDLLLTKQGGWRSSRGFTKTIGFISPKKSDPEYDRAQAFKARAVDLVGELSAQNVVLEALQELRNLPAALPDSQWQLLEAMAEVLPHLVAHLKMVFQQLGATDYTEVSQAALVALGDEDAPTDLALKLDVQVQHILVDEFQDTSQLQLQLLQKLTAGWQTDDGRTLFIVGDGMQSCYAFRNANVGIFLEARETGIGAVALEPLDLSVNFRSEEPVVEWVNTVFTQAFPLRDNISRGAVRYLPSVAFRPRKWPSAPVQFHGCIDDPERTAEAMRITEIVQARLLDDPDSRIAILVRKKRHLETILPALNSAGIDYQAPELAPLASKMSIIDLLSLTRALLDPSDRLSWLSVLRAPWCGLCLTDLHTVAQYGNGDRHVSDSAARPLLLALQERQDIDGLSDDGKHRLERVAEVLLTAWQQRARKPLRQWIEGTWLALGGPSSVSNPEECENLPDFFALLERHDNGFGIGDWQQFQLALERLFARPGGTARVQVMTIHRSKGLEFEHVLIPGLDRGGKPGGDQLLRWASWHSASGEPRFLLAPKSARGGTDALFDYLKHDNNERERLEGTRLLYVGCTRAIRSLHLLACVEHNGDKPEFKSPGRASLLASIWPAINQSEDWCVWHQEETPATTDTPGKQANFDYLLRLPSDWRPPAIQHGQWLAPFRMPDYQPRDSEESNLPEIGHVRQRWQRHAGTVAHEALATLTESSERFADHSFVEKQRPLWLARLRQLGLGATDMGYALEKVESAVLRTLDCATGRWLLDGSHRDSACELELHSGGKQLRRSIVDRTFIDDDGTRWIVDYKTAEPADGENRDDFLAQQAEHYRGQLDRYRELFYQRGERAVRCALYFPLLQVLLPVD